MVKNAVFFMSVVFMINNSGAKIIKILMANLYENIFLHSQTTDLTKGKGAFNTFNVF